MLSLIRIRGLIIIFFFSSLILHAQSKPLTGEDRDSILRPIGNLILETKYVTAQNDIVLNLVQHKDDPILRFMLYVMLSDIERLTGSMEAALFYNSKSKDQIVDCKGDTFDRMVYVVYQSRANLYFEMGETDSAYVYATASINSSQQYNPGRHESNLCRNLSIIGYYHYEKGNYEEAEKLYNQNITLNNKYDHCSNPLVYIKLVDIYIKQEEWGKGVMMGEKALSVADSCNLYQYKMTALEKLIQILKYMKDFERVAGYQQMKIDLEHEQNVADQKKQLQELETKFKTKLKEEENKSLKLINEEQERENRLQLGLIILSGTIITVILIFAIVLFQQKKRITKQKKDVDRLNLLNQKIFSVISHDFKGPMLGIEMLLNMQDKYNMDAETFTNQSKQLKNDIKQANLIMENLLNWSKTELGFSGIDKKDAEVRKVSEEVIAQLQSLLDQKKLVLVNQLPENTLSLPSDILKIIFRNLLTNAIKYSHEGGEILLAYNPDTQTYLVKDQGIGMDAERVKKIFVDKIDSKLGTYRESGYGIGLNIVHELILKNMGRIWAESKLNEGTSIYLTFA